MNDSVARFIGNLSASVVDPGVWIAISVALLMALVAALLGYGITRITRVDPASQVLVEGAGLWLTLGLLSILACYAAIRSHGGSSFTPIALMIVASLGWALRRRNRQPATDEERPKPSPPRRQMTFGLLGCAGFLIATGLAFGATTAPSAADGLQQVEFMDEAYYSQLAVDLIRDGRESIYVTGGFDDVPGLPPQTWYHWGEIWLAAVAVDLFQVEPIPARHYIALPLILLATSLGVAALTRRFGTTRSKWSIALAVAVALAMAPIPMPGTWFAYWARSGIFSVTMYGLAMALVPSAILLIVEGNRRHGPALLLVAALGAALIPTHIVVAGLALFGLVVAIAFGVLSQARSEGAALLRRIWRPTVIGAAAIAITVVWGMVTGHGIGTSAPSTVVAPFNPKWLEAVSLTTAGTGVMFAVLLLIAPGLGGGAAVRPWAVGTLAAVMLGALAWGYRAADFTMFHAYYSAIAVLLMPLAAVAIWLVLSRLRAAGFRFAAPLVGLLVCLQLTVGAVAGIQRLQEFGPHEYKPVPVALLATIRSLPEGAKIAYACGQIEEIGFFWDPRLISLGVHGHRRVMPMCFQAETLSQLNGAPLDPTVMAPQFAIAPQRSVWPAFASAPGTDEIKRFFAMNGIEYIYADDRHPNVLVPDATVVFSAGDQQLLRVP